MLTFGPGDLRQPRFGGILRDTRRVCRLTLRGVAAEAGVAAATWFRMELGEDCSLSAAAAAAAWVAARWEKR